MPSRKRKATLQASVAKRWARGVETVDDAAADSSSAYQLAAVGAGFVGGGNRCFLNATLQALSHLPAIARLLPLPGALHGINGCPLAGAPSCSVCLLGETMRQQLQGARGTCVSAAALHKRLHDLNALPRSDQGLQQDG